MKIVRENVQYRPVNGTFDPYSLMPNPNDGNMQLWQAQSDSEPVQIKVYDVIGSLIYSASRSFDANMTSLDLSKEAPGMYHIVLQDSKGISYSLQFIKR